MLMMLAVDSLLSKMCSAPTRSLIASRNIVFVDRTKLLSSCPVSAREAQYISSLGSSLIKCQTAEFSPFLFLSFFLVFSGVLPVT